MARRKTQPKSKWSRTRTQRKSSKKTPTPLTKRQQATFEFLMSGGKVHDDSEE